MPILLLTDFSSSDGYVGTLKGVIAKISPSFPIIDLAHELPPFDIPQAALVLYQSYAYFPEGSIFVTVVDPGVGSERKAILVKTEKYFFIGPDNGIFTLALAGQKIEKIIHLSNAKYFMSCHCEEERRSNPARTLTGLPRPLKGLAMTKISISPTFHGRDIFAPVAAYLAQGIPIEKFGEELKDYQKREDFFPIIQKKFIEGIILGIDRFGNLITNLSRSFLNQHFPNLKFTAEIKKQKISQLFNHYAQSKNTKAFLIFGSSDLLEISVKQGSAERLLKVKRGDKIKISL